MTYLQQLQSLLICVFAHQFSVTWAQNADASFSRDGYGRSDPNKLLNGFFPAWPVLLLCLAGVFLAIALISFILYTLGCRAPRSDFKKVPTVH